jgi:PD-(D/E)XK nuclease superfamily
MWLEHLLLVSMPQHESGAWSWEALRRGPPCRNLDIADGCARYRDLLVDQSTFSSMTLEELLDAKVLPGRTTAALRSRYLPS